MLALKSGGSFQVRRRSFSRIGGGGGFTNRGMPAAGWQAAAGAEGAHHRRLHCFACFIVLQVGQPYLEGVQVQAEVLEELKGPKVGGRVWRGAGGWAAGWEGEGWAGGCEARWMGGQWVDGVGGREGMGGCGSRGGGGRAAGRGRAGGRRGSATRQSICAQKTGGAEVGPNDCTFPTTLQIVIFKMKPKKHFRRTTGHRQPLTKILITKIGA